MFKKAVLLALYLLFIINQAQAEVLDEEAMVMSVGDAKNHSFSLTFFSMASVVNMKPGKQSPSLTERMIDTYDYLSLNYRLTNISKISMQLPVVLTSNGINEYGDQKSSRLAMGDIHFVYSNYDLGYIGDFDFSGNAKLFLPTSPYSQAARTIAKIRLEGFFLWQFAQYSSLQYVVKPDIFLQSQTAFFNPDDIPQYDDGTYMRDPRGTTKQYSLEHFLQVNFDLNKKYSVVPKVGFAEDWYYSSAAEQLEGGHVTKMRAGLSFELRPFTGLSFTFGVQNDTFISSASNDGTIAFFQPENSSYSLMTNVFLF